MPRLGPRRLKKSLLQSFGANTIAQKLRGQLFPPVVNVHSSPPSKCLNESGCNEEGGERADASLDGCPSQKRLVLITLICDTMA